MTSQVAGQAHDTVPGRRRDLMAALDVAADETRRWLLDDSDGRAGPATASQEAALRLLERRRQAGRRRLRETTIFEALPGAGAAAEALVRGIGIEDGPAWQTPAGLTIRGAHTVTAPAPGAERWAYTLRAVNPPASVASMTQAELGDVVLDGPGRAGWSDGWTVTSTPRAAPAGRERDVTIAQTAEPAPGTYTFALTARNAAGPSNLVVTITVPAAAEGA